MKCYLVGGAVRDQLLNYPVKEQDWVVVGSTPEKMKELGFKQVGRDFPVFLHPKTNEEYALARTERKSAPGYYGFACDASPAVTLEEDLLRRDLTINAMAMDEQGQLIDPYQGLNDLQEKKLRHVSPAFVEDPVRVLRAARFMARYYHLGFTIAPETRLLMYNMVKAKELHHLIAERVWQELFKSLQEKSPAQFIVTLRECDALAVLFPEIEALFGVPNPAKYHPEIDSGVHTLMTLQAAALLSDDPLIRFAALVHDLGKAKTSMHDWPKHRGHELTGLQPIELLCKRLRVPVDYQRFAIMVCRIHLNIHRLFELRPATIVKIFEQADAFRKPDLFVKLLTVCAADANGSGVARQYKQADQWRFILNECLKITAKPIVEQGYQGVAIKHELYQRRVACTKMIINSWTTHD